MENTNKYTLEIHEQAEPIHHRKIFSADLSQAMNPYPIGTKLIVHGASYVVIDSYVKMNNKHTEDEWIIHFNHIIVVKPV